MAIFATVRIDKALVYPGQTVEGLVSVLNTGANPLNVSAVTLSTSPATSASASLTAALPQGAGVSGVGGPAGALVPVVPATLNSQATLSYPFSFVAGSPQVPGASQLHYTVGASVLTSDGTLTAAATAQVDVLPPLTSALVASPVASFGQARFDSTLSSYLAPIVIFEF